MSKKVLIAVVILAIYLALVWAVSLLVLKGSNSVLVGVVLSVCGLTLLGVFLLITKLAPGAAGGAAAAGGLAVPQMPQVPQLGQMGGARDPDADALQGLIREANEVLGRSPKLASQRVKSTITDFPLYFVMGSEGAGKTSVFLGSKREPELLSGQISRDSAVAATRLVNIFFTDGSIVVEAGGGYYSGDAGRWGQMLAAFRRGGNQSLWGRLFGSGSTVSNLGGVVLCCDSTSFLGVPDNNKLTAMARQAQQRLRAVAAQFAGDVPVYVIFTKADGVPYFGDYFSRLPESEEQQILGCTRYLAGGPASATGVYGEAETSRITSALNKLYYSLADWRLAVLEREPDRAKKPNIYEFPRELKRIRSQMVQFLVDVFRPDPLQFNAVLEGFYFTGTRKVAGSLAPGAGGGGRPSGLELDRSVVFKVGDVTRMMRFEEMQQQFKQQPEASGRGPEITRWAFAADAWRQILRPQPMAATPVFVNRKDQFYRKMIFVGVTVFFGILTALFLTSFLLNHALVSGVQEAAAACEPLAAGAAPTDVQLEHFDALRERLEYLETHGSGFLRNWGMYQGKRLIDETESVYFARFREYFLNGIVARLGSEMSGLPPSPVASAPYDMVYDDLKTYRTITKSPVETSCVAEDSLAARLLALWRTGQTQAPGPEAERIARASFGFYVQTLRAPRPSEAAARLTLASNDNLVVRRGRDYLGSFKGIEPLYQRLKDQVNKELHSVARLQELTRDTSYRKVLDVQDEVQAAFTQEGWKKMQALIENAGSAKGAEACVVGSGAQGGAAMAAGDDVKAQLRQMYAKDYIQRWNEYLAKASVRPYEGCGDASGKLTQLGGNTSAMLAALMFADMNTNFPRPAAPGGAAGDDPIATAFQPVAAVFAGAPNPNKWSDDRNGPYLEGLGNLQHALDGLNKDGQCNTSDQAATQAAAGALNAAQAAVDKLALNFNVGPAGETVKKFLEEPLTAARKLVNTDPNAVAKAKINGAQAGLCKALASLERKYPFNGASEEDANIDEVTKVFSAPDGPLGAVLAAVKDQVVKAGGVYSLKPDATVKLNRTFIDFLNRMTAIADALYAKAGAPPSMRYRITVQPNPAMKQVMGKIDGQTASMASTEYDWPGPGGGVDLRVEQAGGGNSAFRGFKGTWAIFRLMNDAVHTPGSDQFGFVNVQGGRGSSQQAILADNSPIVLEVTQYPNGVRQAFDRTFFQVRCPGRAAD